MKVALLLTSFLLAGLGFAADASYSQAIETARAKRLAELTKADGWLSLVGLHFLNPGANTVGKAADNRIVLAAGPAHFGTVTLTPAGVVTFSPSAGSDVSIDGQPVTRETVLRLGEGSIKPAPVTSDTVSFFVIERGGRKALRVRDTASERRAHFAGLNYFPIDSSWRIEAQWVPFESAQPVAITNVIGQVSTQRAPGKAVFQRDGKTYELLPILEGPNEPLFFVISDATSGKQSYRMRFLDAEQPKDGKVVLDFNLAENPPCAFTPFATCPLPPKENRLPIAITAGEKDYRGKHD